MQEQVTSLQKDKHRLQSQLEEKRYNLDKCRVCCLVLFLCLHQWYLRMLLGIKWYQFVQNDDVWRLTKQPKLTAIIQSCRLTLFGHNNIMRMDDNTDAKSILLASPPADWRRQLGRPRITWLSTIQQDLKQHHLALSEAADLAQNRPLWRTMSMCGCTQS